MARLVLVLGILCIAVAAGVAFWWFMRAAGEADRPGEGGMGGNALRWFGFLVLVVMIAVVSFSALGAGGTG